MVSAAQSWSPLFAQPLFAQPLFAHYFFAPSFWAETSPANGCSQPFAGSSSAKQSSDIRAAASAKRRGRAYCAPSISLSERPSRLRPARLVLLAPWRCGQLGGYPGGSGSGRCAVLQERHDIGMQFIGRWRCAQLIDRIADAQQYRLTYAVTIHPKKLMLLIF